ncbi:type II secretion system F family protein [Protofrankia symbiont of Coriaria ruscifolia]|uniref:type II secretion system F family protein n=1 Tax=Protofrankia symbiont of Coriaria ruscifolia TaxID=1306542 RepID=UPI0010419B1C|nr:type II secretion system F family protein [Protofrankia symbiont of Coriaria ruscifolia]
MSPGLRFAALVLSGATVGAGAWLLITAPQGGPLPIRAFVRRMPAGAWRPVALGTGMGLVGGTAVGMPVLALLTGGAVWVALEIRRGPNIPAQNALGDAVATWCETVRQELGAGQPLRAAVAASCALPPPALAHPLRRLAAALDGAPLPDALQRFRAEVDHPAVGAVVTALTLAYRHGAGDLAQLMAEQVDSTRHRVAVLRDTHAARAKYRRSMVLLLALFAVSVLGLLAAWPALLDPYRTAVGQLVLAGIITLVLGAVRTLIRLSQPPPIPDFFTARP